MSGKFYRIDKFTVPGHGRAEFLDKVRKTHEVLQTQEGFVRDYILEERTRGDASKILTFVEWADDEAVRSAGQAVQALHRKLGFNPRDLFERLGIEAELGSYRPLNAD